MNPNTPVNLSEKWTVGRVGCVVSDTPQRENDHESDREYYGGYCVAESIPSAAKAQLLASALDLLKVAKAASHALRSYKYGNASTALAKQTADAIDEVTRKAQHPPQAESGRPCGCDPGANWVCSAHREPISAAEYGMEHVADDAVRRSR